MAYQSNATQQPKVYRVNLTIADSDLDEALVQATLDLAAQTNGAWADLTVLKNAGLFEKYLHNAVHAAVVAQYDSE